MIMIKRIWVLFMARNREFLRDRAGFGWNILFPFLIVLGFGLIYDDTARQQVKAGYLTPSQDISTRTDDSGNPDLPPALASHPLVEWVSFESRQTAMDKLVHHKVDILVTREAGRVKYWVNTASPKGMVAEKVIREASLPDQVFSAYVEGEVVSGSRIRYIDWLFPGILGMNIMFSAFFGVSYVIARYRRNGVLKRLKATPVTAFDYLSSQLLSRVAVLCFSTLVVWLGCDLFFAFQIQGNWLTICLVFLAGICCMVSLGLVLACRGTNEELTNGIINFICWPMMLLSEVWFSIEGAAGWVKQVAELLPLTHFLRAARAVVNDGAALYQVSFELCVLTGFTLVCLALGAFFFSWTR